MLVEDDVEGWTTTVAVDADPRTVVVECAAPGVYVRVCVATCVDPLTVRVMTTVTVVTDGEPVLAAGATTTTVVLVEEGPFDAGAAGAAGEELPAIVKFAHARAVPLAYSMTRLRLPMKAGLLDRSER